MIKVEVTDIKPITFEFHKIPKLSWPASISALRLEGSPSPIHPSEWEKYGVEIITLTIVWMIALGQIKVLRAVTKKSLLSIKIRSTIEYLFQADIKESNTLEGWLEKEIFYAMNNSEVRISSNTLFPGALIDKVVWTIIGSYKLWPAHKVAFCVQTDAKNRGLGKSHLLVSPEFVFEKTLLEDLLKEQEKAYDLADQFMSNYTTLHQAITKRVRKGIRSRTRVVDSDEPEKFC